MVHINILNFLIMQLLGTYLWKRNLHINEMELYSNILKAFESSDGYKLNLFNAAFIKLLQ